MSGDLIIRNAMLNNGLRDIVIKKGIISRVTIPGGPDIIAGTVEFDAGGRIAVPGMIDPHVHMRCPGMEEKEDWTSGGRAALAGGVTTVIDMPNTKPATETPEALDLKRAAAEKADKAAAREGGAVPRRLYWAGCSPETLSLLPQMLAGPDVAGVKLFFSESSSNKSSSEIDFVTDVFSAAAASGKPVAVHTELAQFLYMEGHGDINDKTENMNLLALHNRLRSSSAAEIGTSLALGIAAKTGCRLYLCHLSTEYEFKMVRDHKTEYGRDSVIAELTPHHLLLDEDHIVEGGGPAWAKVNPPLRSRSDRKAAAEALLDGTIDLIGSDHAPHLPAEKALPDFFGCPSGFPGLETSLGLVAGFLKEHAPPAPESGRSWPEMLGRLTNNRAAEIFNLEDRNGISEGKYADIVILGGPSKIDASSFKSKARYSPFSGMEMPVSVYKTIIGGKPIGQ